MPLDNQVNITVTGKNEAGPALRSAGNDVDALRQQLEKLQESFKVERDTNGMSAAAEKMRGQMNDLRRAIDDAKGGVRAAQSGIVEAAQPAEEAIQAVNAAAAGTVAAEGAVTAAAGEAGSALAAVGTVGAIAFAAVAAAIAAVVAAAAVAVSAVQSIVRALEDCFAAAAGWEGMVQQITELSGVSSEAASMLGYIATVAGSTPAAVEQSMATNSRILGSITDAMKDKAKQTEEAIAAYNEKTTEQAQTNLEKREQDAAAHAERVASIHKSAGDQIESYNERMAEREEDRRRQQISDVENQQQRMADLEERHTASMASLNQSLADMQESQAQRAEDRAARLADKLESYDQRNADRRISLQMRVSTARDDAEKKALETQLADFDSNAAKERQKLVDQASEEEKRAQAADEKAMQRLQARIAAEEAAYVKQLDRQQMAFEKAEREKEASYARDTDRQEKAQARASAAFAERLAAEEASYAKMSAAREKALTDAAAKQQKDFEKHLEKLKTDLPPVAQALKELGLDFDALQKMSPDEQFFAIANGINQIDDAHKKLDLLNRIYGRGGWKSMMEIIEVMGTKTLPEWKEAVEGAGLASSEVERQGFRDFQRGMREMNLQLEGVRVQIGKDLLPVFQTLLSEFEKFWKTHGQEVSKWLIQAVKEWIPNFIRSVELAGTALDKIANSPLFKIIAWFMEGSGALAKTFGNFIGDFERAFGLTKTNTPSSPSQLSAPPGWVGPWPTSSPSSAPPGWVGPFVPSSVSSNPSSAPPGWVGPWPTSSPSSAPPGWVGPWPTSSPSSAPPGWVGPWPQSQQFSSGGATLNITNNYPSPPVSKDDSVRYYLYSLGLGGRQ